MYVRDIKTFEDKNYKSYSKKRPAKNERKCRKQLPTKKLKMRTRARRVGDGKYNARHGLLSQEYFATPYQGGCIKNTCNIPGFKRHDTLQYNTYFIMMV